MVRVIERIEEAPTLLIKRIASETNALIQNGAPILNLSQGTPNLPLFDSAYEAAVSTLASRHLPYTDVAGDVTVRQVCADFLNTIVLGRRRRNDMNHNEGQKGKEEEEEGTKYTPRHICLTNGAVGAVYCALAVQIDGPSDMVVAPLPAYGLYMSDTSLLGGTFRPLACGTPRNGFLLSALDVRRAFDECGERLRCFILCAPNNPTGQCLTEHDARELVKEFEHQLERYPHSFSILLDEVYTGISSSSSDQDIDHDNNKNNNANDTTCTNGHVSLLRYASPALRRVCFITLSASKGLGGVPGARAGFVACADAHLMSNIAKMQMATSANISVVGQQILRSSLRHILSDPHRILQQIANHYKERTDYVCRRLQDMGIKYTEDGTTFCPCRPRGTFYVCARFECLGETDLDVQRMLRDAYKKNDNGCNDDAESSTPVEATASEPPPPPPPSHGVAVIPLSAFAMDEKLCMVRLSCALDLDLLEKAMDVIECMVGVAMTKKRK